MRKKENENSVRQPTIWADSHVDDGNLVIHECNGNNVAIVTCTRGKDLNGIPAFQVNSLNELTTNVNSGTLTVVGSTTSASSSVTVNGASAYRYGDNTFAVPGLPLTNAYTAVGQSTYGASATNTVSVNIATNTGFLYDGNGNLTNDGLRNFAYDDENQLIQVWVASNWMSLFQYDAKMRRRIRKEFTWQTNAWVETNEVHYVYDGNLVIQERDSNNIVLVTYTRGKDLSGSLEGAGGIGGLLARTAAPYSGASSGQSYYHCDANGNVTVLIDANQGIVAQYLYDAFGNTISKSGLLADANLYRFSSKEWHANSGLAYYLYRYYDPNLQRWQNRDPLYDLGSVLLSGKHRRLEQSGLYTFIDNNPISNIDPNGLLLGALLDGLQNFGCPHLSGNSCKLCCALAFQAALATDSLEGGAIIAGGIAVGPVTIGAGTAAATAIGLGDIALSHANDIKAFKDCLNSCCQQK